MKAKQKFNWGQEVEVLAIAPVKLNPNQRGSVCGMRQIESEYIYIVEFSNGVAVEIPENFLREVTPEK